MIVWSVSARRTLRLTLHVRLDRPNADAVPAIASVVLENETCRGVDRDALHVPAVGS